MPLEIGFQRDDVQLARRAVELLHDGLRQVGADAPHQFARVGDGGRVLRQALDDRAHVAAVNAFLPQ